MLKKQSHLRKARSARQKEETQDDANRILSLWKRMRGKLA
jgi:hypothetical protein